MYMSKPRYKLAKGTALAGIGLRLLMGSYSAWKFRVAGKFLHAIYRGRGDKRTLRRGEIYIPSGDNTLRVVTYEDKCASVDNIALLWIHGGGYAMGIPEQEVVFAKKLCHSCHVKMYLPDYTLSVDKPYPRGLEDCYTTLLYLYDHAEELGVDRDKIIVGGDSAGGGLTIALCLLARDRGVVKIAGHIPLYPMIDCRETETSRDNHAPVWDTLSNNRAWDIYLRDVDRNSPPIYASPSLAESYEGMPPCVTLVGEHDPFLAETRRYVERLKSEGIDTYYREYEGCYHAFDVIARNSPSARESGEFLVESVQDMISKL
ncbi:MAG: alpha/beta hydrolase [Clostridia bacterium]|nr:alpha/beta hydrolase [Clostridia bacterium]